MSEQNQLNPKVQEPLTNSKVLLTIFISIIVLCILMIIMGKIIIAQKKLGIFDQSTSFVSADIFQKAVKACETFEGISRVEPLRNTIYCNNGYEINFSQHFKEERATWQNELERREFRLKKEAAEKLAEDFKKMSLDRALADKRCLELGFIPSSISKWNGTSTNFQCTNGFSVNYETLTEEQKARNNMLAREMDLKRFTKSEKK